jgi:S-adenosylmethionine decarboxylase
VKLYVSLAVWAGCPRDWLDDESALRAVLTAAVQAGPFTLYQLVVQRFSPQGVTACAVVGESHLALHSWPEEGRLFFDVASCSTQESARRAVEAVTAALPSGRLEILDEHVIEPASSFPKSRGSS